MQSKLKLVVTVEPGRRGLGLLAPDPSLEIGNWQLVLNPEGPVDADFWIVFANARPADRVNVAPENTLLIVGEPEEKKVYPKNYYNQFYRLVDTHRSSGHPRLELHAPCLDWHVGIDHEAGGYRYGYAHLAGLECPTDRLNKVSVVCSDAGNTEGQRARLNFLDELKNRLGDRIEHFGRGFQPVNDKMDAILGYRFHLVLENSRAPHYWTEKIADSYLGWAYPVYYGCSTIGEYFPKGSFAEIGQLDPGLVGEQVLKLLESPAESEQSGLESGRRLILDRYNPLVSWARWAGKYYQPGARKGWLTLRSHKAFRPFPRGLLFRLRTSSERLTGPDRAAEASDSATHG